jgi:rhodanese-related sulfurtransferase
MKNCKSHILLISVAALLCIPGCSIDRSYDSSNQMLANAKEGIHTISAREFREIMGRGDDFKLIDCREADEAGAGHMPGAINIPRGMLEFEITKLYPLRGTRIYIYCETGQRSALAAETLQTMKYSNVTSIEGGWNVWTKAYPDKIELKDSKKEIIKDSKEEAVTGGGSCGG